MPCVSNGPHQTSGPVCNCGAFTMLSMYYSASLTNDQGQLSPVSPVLLYYDTPGPLTSEIVRDPACAWGGAKRVSDRGLYYIFDFNLLSPIRACSQESIFLSYLGVDHYFFPDANLPFGHVPNLSISARPYLSDPHCVARLM
jgi:hypothetical protein